MDQPTATMRTAFVMWLANAAYVGPKGHYRVKATGRIAPWSAHVRSRYATSDEFHNAAHVYDAALSRQLQETTK